MSYNNSVRKNLYIPKKMKKIKKGVIYLIIISPISPFPLKIDSNLTLLI